MNVVNEVEVFRGPPAVARSRNNTGDGVGHSQPSRHSRLQSLWYTFQSPSLGPLLSAHIDDAQATEPSVTHGAERTSQTNPLALLALVPESQIDALLAQCRADRPEVNDAHLAIPVPLPPGLHECPPRYALSVRRVIEILQIREKARNASHHQEPTHDSSPAFEHAKRLPGFPALEHQPGLDYGENGPDKVTAVRGNPGSEIRVSELCSEPRLLHIGVQPDADSASSDLV